MMTDEEIDNDIDDNDTDIDAELADGAEDSEAASEGSAAREEPVSEVSMAMREQMRQQLQDEVEAFLSKGGKIDYIEPNVSADPPQKPQNNYCSRPI